MLIGNHGGMTNVTSASGNPNAVTANIAYTAPDEPSDHQPSFASRVACAAATSVASTVAPVARAAGFGAARAVEEAEARRCAMRRGYRQRALPMCDARLANKPAVMAVGKCDGLEVLAERTGDEEG